MSEEETAAPAAPPQAPAEPARKTPSEALTLRGTPRRVVRFKRSVIIGGAATGAIVISGVAWLAFSHHPLHVAMPVDQQETDRRAPADAVANLPGDYSKVPQLGPPLPGDLGRPILERQREIAGQGGPTVQTAEQQRAEAERQRVAQQAAQAREAGVMVQPSARPATSAVGGADAGAAAAATATASEQGDKLALDPEHDQNGQQRKLDFVSHNSADSIYDGHTLQTLASPYEVMAGSIIAASLITGLDSDLPGTVIAQVTENVFDTVTGRILLIPQGSRLIGNYDSVVAFGQKRALLVWQRIILPDGSSIQIDNLPATDTAGYAGLQDRVDFHTWQLLKGVALSTLLGIGTQISIGSDRSDLIRAIRESSQQSASEAGQQIVSKQLNVQPTLKVRPGWPLRVIVHRDLVLREWSGAEKGDTSWRN
jgi:type IV secretory pathway VirB10-like protein